jgi:hypothetical protein
MKSLPMGLLLLAAVVAVGAAPPPKCTADEYRQFDFWIGDWEVTNAAGEIAGTSRVRVLFGGCVLQEEWTGARGVTGAS